MSTTFVYTARDRSGATTEGEIEGVVSCNCSMCSRAGWLLWFVTPEQFTLKTPASALGNYEFNKHVIHHKFCPKCGIKPFSEGVGPGGKPMLAINVRCLDGVDLASLSPIPYDGKSA